MPGTVMDRLREETAEQHKHAESRPLELALVDGSISGQAYRGYLGQRLCLHGPLEQWTGELVAGDARLGGLGLDTLWQTPNLQRDLQFLQVETPVALPQVTAFLNELKAMQATCPTSVLGSYYVFEGSKNGARFIAKSIREALGLEQDGCRYLDPHGNQQRALWKAFKEEMNKVAFRAEEEDAMVEAAKRTFDAVAEVDDAIAADLLAADVD